MGIHRQLLDRLKAGVEETDHAFKPMLDKYDDTRLLHVIFKNFRGTPEDGIGLRLTDTGLELMSAFFKPYRINLDADYTFGAHDMIFMEQKAKLPYFIGYEPLPPKPNEKRTKKVNYGERGPAKLIVYESMLGIMLRMNDGSVTDLRTMGNHW